MISTNHRTETAVIVGILTGQQNVHQQHDHLEELRFLASTLGLKVVGKFTQKLPHPQPYAFVGKGKLQQIHQFVQEQKADLVIFDDDLTPSQLRNLEKELKTRIYDRSLLILDIFLKRAQTSQARTQVELARYQYLLPRLTRMWTHLERQRGGTGTRGGAGEKEIETDRRIIRKQISVLRQKLDKIEKQSETRRKSREKVVRVALVGYTNTGKSTLMKLLSKADVKAEDKLFATVDSTVRRVHLKDITFLLSDTVGFIRKLPHHLIESFKSTLDEVREADILVHVVDISHSAFEEQMEVVNTTLTDLGVVDRPTLMVFNKIDLFGRTNGEELLSADQLRSTFFGNGSQPSVFISAINKTNLEELKNSLYAMVKRKYITLYPNYLSKKLHQN